LEQIFFWTILIADPLLQSASRPWLVLSKLEFKQDIPVVCQVLKASQSSFQYRHILQAEQCV